MRVVDDDEDQDELEGQRIGQRIGLFPWQRQASISKEG